MGVERRQLRRCLNSMALPLTVQTETDLVTRTRCLPSVNTDQGIEHRGEADLHIQIDRQEVRRELEMMTMPIDLEAIREHSKSTTKLLLKTINAVLEYPMKI
jgi:hypothetical protein